MGKKAVYKKFEAGYEADVIELLVLTSEAVGNAGAMGEGVWLPSAGILESVEPVSGALRGAGKMVWLAEEKERAGWIFNLKPLTIYHIKCRREREKALPEDAISFAPLSLMLVDVLERDLHHPALKRVLEEYMRPVVLTDELCGEFTLDRQFDCFYGDVDWLGDACSVALECDEEEKETAEGALAAFKTMYGNLQEWDNRFRAFAARKLTERANDWLEDEDSQPITEADFAQRISISECNIGPGGDYTAYYDDDDLFYGHIILIEGNVEGEMEDAYIAG